MQLKDHFVLRTALPGAGEIRIEDGEFTKLPRGAITEREAARLTRQQLGELALPLEAYRIDNNRYPDRLEDVLPIYARFVPTIDPYGRPYVASLSPDAYVLT